MIQPNQLTANQVIQIFRNEAVYLFLGAAFTTVGLVAAAFALLRRRFEPLLINFALFAILYGSRLWLKSPLLALLFPGSILLTAIRMGINYVVPIPAFFFFLAVGFLPRFGKAIATALTVIFVALATYTPLPSPTTLSSSPACSSSCSARCSGKRSLRTSALSASAC